MQMFTENKVNFIYFMIIFIFFFFAADEEDAILTKSFRQQTSNTKCGNFK